MYRILAAAISCVYLFQPVLACRCIVTTSAYTKDEDFETADAIYDCIGDAGEERFSLNDLTPQGVTDPKVVNA